MIHEAHRIRRLRWRVQVSSCDEAFALRPGLKDSVTSAILPELERAFDALEIGSDVLHIERLEAVVRVGRGEDVERACVDAIRQQFGEPLAALAPTTARPASEQQGGRAKRHERQWSRLASLLHYLETGALPWHLEPVATAASLARQLADAARDEVSAVLERLPPTAAAAASFLFRLFALLPCADWPDIARRIGQHRSDRIGGEILDAIELVAAAPADNGTRHARVELTAALITRYARPDSAFEGSPTGLVPELSVDAARFAGRLVLPPQAQTLLGLHDGVHRYDAERRAAQQTAAGDLPLQARGATGQEERDELPLETSPGKDFGAGVANVGLILLAPFLPRLFEARSIARPDERALAPPVLRRACALLHFAATGREDGHEFELGFVKVLLGLSPAHPVAFARGILTRGDRGEVETLLGSVIEHWRALEHISTDGLRQVFLQRRGLVSQRDNYWDLQVEPASIDVLLEHLPWGIRAVSVPWVGKPIETGWAGR